MVKLLSKRGWLWHEDDGLGESVALTEDFRVAKSLNFVEFRDSEASPLPLWQHGQYRRGKRFSGGELYQAAYLVGLILFSAPHGNRYHHRHATGATGRCPRRGRRQNQRNACVPPHPTSFSDTFWFRMRSPSPRGNQTADHGPCRPPPEGKCRLPSKRAFSRFWKLLGQVEGEQGADRALFHYIVTINGKVRRSIDVRSWNTHYIAPGATSTIAWVSSHRTLGSEWCTSRSTMTSIPCATSVHVRATPESRSRSLLCEMPRNASTHSSDTTSCSMTTFSVARFPFNCISPAPYRSPWVA